MICQTVALGVAKCMSRSVATSSQDRVLPLSLCSCSPQSFRVGRSGVGGGGEGYDLVLAYPFPEVRVPIYIKGFALRLSDLDWPLAFTCILLTQKAPKPQPKHAASANTCNARSGFGGSVVLLTSLGL